MNRRKQKKIYKKLLKQTTTSLITNFCVFGTGNKVLLQSIYRNNCKIKRNTFRRDCNLLNTKRYINSPHQMFKFY